jgi:hypothetical protein
VIFITSDAKRACYFGEKRLFSAPTGTFGIPAPTFRPLGAAVAPEPQKIPGVACETSQDLLIIIRAAA